MASPEQHSKTSSQNLKKNKAGAEDSFQVQFLRDKVLDSILSTQGNSLETEMSCILVGLDALDVSACGCTPSSAGNVAEYQGCWPEFNPQYCTAKSNDKN